MISDEERREVAKRLREISYKPGWSLGDWWLRVHGAVVGSEHCLCPQEDVAVIADLIDIPTCVMTDVGGDFENSFQCSNCKNEFDMPDYDRYPYKRCPECGAVVLNAD